MRILLRNVETGLYGNGNGACTEDRSQGHNFFLSQQAYQHALEHQLANTEVVFAFEDVQFDFTLPPIKSLSARPRI